MSILDHAANIHTLGSLALEKSRMSFAASTKTRLTHEAIKPNIGSRVLNSKKELLGGQMAREIRELLEQRGVLVFPEIHFSDEEQIAFTKTLGTFEPERRGWRHLQGHARHQGESAQRRIPQGLALLASRRHDERRADPRLAACEQEARRAGAATPASATPTPLGKALPEEQKAELEGLRVMHSVWASVFYYEPEPSLAKLKGMQAIGERELPLVWKHRSGRKSLILGCTAHRVLGVSAAKSAEILVGLREWATSEQFSYSHEWKVGDLVMWDNTGTMHRAEAYDLDSGRMLHRTKLQGEESFA